eukprot:2716458-Rhodomonas_salina.1
MEGGLRDVTRTIKIRCIDLYCFLTRFRRLPTVALTLVTCYGPFHGTGGATIASCQLRTLQCCNSSFAISPPPLTAPHRASRVRTAHSAAHTREFQSCAH